MNAAEAPARVPLCVDLDGTLLRGDLLWESLALLLRDKPWLVFALPVWLMAGRAALKRRILQQVRVPVESLPYLKRPACKEASWRLSVKLSSMRARGSSLDSFRR